MEQPDVAALVDLLAVTQQWYFDLRPIAISTPNHNVPQGSVRAFEQLETKALEVLGQAAFQLVPPLRSLKEQWSNTPTYYIKYLSALQWTGALHAYMLNKLPPQEEKTRQRMGLLPRDQ